jgi:DNA-binding MarR family transcriptional regulator
VSEVRLQVKTSPQKGVNIMDKATKRRLKEQHNFVVLDEQEQKLLETLEDQGGLALAAQVIAETGMSQYTLSRTRKSLEEEGMINTFLCASVLRL